MKDKKNLIGIAFSDIHLEDWTSHNKDHYRLNYVVDFMFDLLNEAKDKLVPLIFCGDLIHNPKSMGNRVHASLGTWVDKVAEEGVSVFAIDGNHDQCEKSTLENPSLSYLDGISRITNVSFAERYYRVGPDATRVIYYGIPYLKYEDDFMAALDKAVKNLELSKTSYPDAITILLVHQNLPGAKEPDGFEVESDLPKNLYKKFKKFTWVLSGHIHKPQQIFSNTYMLGATHHQDLGDMGCKMGYWYIYSNSEPEFVPSNLPEFKYYKGDKPPDDFHLWVKEGQEINFEEDGKPREFSSGASRKSLAKKYCKAKSVEDKKKIKALVKALNNAD